MSQALGVLMIIVLSYLVSWWLAMHWREVMQWVGGILLVIMAGAGAYNLANELHRLRRHGRD